MLDHAHYAAPTRQHEFDHTDQETSAFKYRDREAGIDDLSYVWNAVDRGREETPARTYARAHGGGKGSHNSFSRSCWFSG